MCGIAGAYFRRQIGDAEVLRVTTMAAALKHRGPDDFSVVRAGSSVLAAQRLAIVDVAHGRQPLSDESGRISAVFNGEIYNYRELREQLIEKGHTLLSHGDGEVIVHLYEDYGSRCVDFLDGQFALAIADTRTGALLLARDRMGICPLHWVETPEAFYFCSEVKGLLAAGAAERAVRPEAIVQMAYFGAVCAPLTPFADVHALPPAHLLRIDRNGMQRPRRYWALSFPQDGEHRRVNAADAGAELQYLMEESVSTHSQGEFPVSCFLSGGIDSAVIGAILARKRGKGEVLDAFCATSNNRKFDESDEARATAELLGIRLNKLEVDEPQLANAFVRLVWHGETPVISTEAAALLLLAGRARTRTKVVLTGEGADEAFGGYLALRQYKTFGAFTRPEMTPLRKILRPLLERHYGSDCLLPADSRIHAVQSHLGFFPAQGYEWEFYRSAFLPVLSADYAALLRAEAQWTDLPWNNKAGDGWHWLNRSLSIGYQVMLPNYLLGTHGDRIFAANSTEGRYPFLTRRIVEFAAALPPDLKIRFLRDKYLLRCAAEKWLPGKIAWRQKRRFMMPFGTPFLHPNASDLFRYLLEPDTLHKFGYFNPAAVLQVLQALRIYTHVTTGARAYLERLALGITATFVVSTQLWHHLFVENRDVPQSTSDIALPLRKEHAGQ